MLQPIVDLATGVRVGAEALSRFPAEWGMAPDVVLRARRTASGPGTCSSCSRCERAAEHLARVDGYVAMNVSPATLLTAECGELLGRLPLDRVLLELSEHDQVEDYAALNADAGPVPRRRPAPGDRRRRRRASPRCGTSCVTAPDVIKVDRSIVAGLDADPVLRDARPLAGRVRPRLRRSGSSPRAWRPPRRPRSSRGLGVDYGQGWHYGRPGPPEALTGVQPAARVPRPRSAERAGLPV